MRVKGSLIFGLFLFAVSLFFLFGSFSYRGMAEFVPLLFSIPTALLTLVALLGERYPRFMRYFEVGLEELLPTTPVQSQNPSAAPREEAKLIAQTFGWFGVFVTILFLAGFYVATALFALLFMRFQERVGWIGSIATTVLAELFLYLVFEQILQVNLFSGIFFEDRVPPL